MSRTCPLCRLFFIVLFLVLIPAATLSGAPKSGFTLRLGPMVSLPVGEDTEYFTTGVGVNLGVTAAPKSFPWMFAALDFTYEYLTLEIDPSASVMSAQGGLGFQFPIGKKLHTEIRGVGGGYYGQINGNRDVGSGGAMAEGTLGVFFGFSKSFELGLETSYEEYFGLGRFVSIGLTGVYRFGANRSAPVDITPSRPLIEAVDAQLLKVDNAEFDEVFPVFYKYYDTNAIGRFRITNVGNEELENLNLNLMVGQYMDTPTNSKVPETLEPGESTKVDVFAFFSDTVLNLEEATKVSAELVFTFRDRGIDRQRTYTQNLRLHGRNSMVWDDLRKPAAYVTPRDTAVMGFSREISAIVRESSHQAIHPSFRTAVALHSALADNGTTYTRDPSSSYMRDEVSLAVDYLQFPRQTLNYRAGDCDDLSILYCSVLESLNIPTAMILVPGHIFMAFNLKIPPAEARSSFPGSENLIFHGEEAWIPLEITSIDEGFLEAWRTGGRQWHEADARGDATFIVTTEAWEAYEPVGLKAPSDNRRFLNSADVLAEYEAQMRSFINQTIYPMETRMLAKMEKEGRKPELVNGLAVLYARYGLYDKARSELDSLLRRYPVYAPAIANLGNIDIRDGRPADAVIQYERALEIDPDNPMILICHARASHHMENYDDAAKSYEKVKELNPALARRYSYLNLKDEDSTRAAESGQETDIFWVEEIQP